MASADARARRAPPLLYTLHVGNLYGTERMALATLDGWRERERILIAPPPEGSLSLLEAARASGHATRQVRSTFGLVRALLPLFLRHRAIDVISTSARHNFVCAWLGRLLFVRLRQLNVVHGGGEDRYSYRNKHRLNGSGVRLVAVSEFVRERLLDHGVEPGNVVVIKNFLAAADAPLRPRRPPFDPSLPGARPIGAAPVRVVVISRVDPVKRIDVLLDAVAAGRLGRFVFDVYGAGEMLASCADRARAAGLPIVFHGWIPDAADRLAEADFFVHLCPAEPFGLVVLEAFLAGVPAIVADAGGTAEIVEHGVNGTTYPAGDADALATCLLEMARCDGARLDALVAGGRRSLRERFSQALGVTAYRRALLEASPAAA